MEELKELKVGDILINERSKELLMVVELIEKGVSCVLLVNIDKGKVVKGSKRGSVTELLSYIDLELNRGGELRKIELYTITYKKTNNYAEKKEELKKGCILIGEEGVGNSKMLIEGVREEYYVLNLEQPKIEGMWYRTVDSVRKAYPMDIVIPSSCSVLLEA